MYPSLLFITFIVTLNSKSVLSSTMKDNYCKLPFSCEKGGLNIDYPFGHEISGYYCGYPGLKVECTDKKPVISIANHLYYVKNLDYSIRRLLTVIGMDVEGKQCPRPTQKPSPLFVVANFNVSIFYNCSSYLPNASHIACLQFLSSKRSYAFSGENPLPKFDWYKNCERNVVLPLLTARSAYLDKMGFLTDSNYSSTLQMGFQLGWSTPSNCTYCESAGGLCRVDSTTSDLTCALGYDKEEVSNPKKEKEVSNQGTSTDIGIAYVLMLVALVVIYLIHHSDACLYSLFGKLKKCSTL